MPAERKKPSTFSIQEESNNEFTRFLYEQIRLYTEANPIRPSEILVSVLMIMGLLVQAFSLNLSVEEVEKIRAGLIEAMATMPVGKLKGKP